MCTDMKAALGPHIWTWNLHNCLAPFMVSLTAHQRASLHFADRAVLAEMARAATWHMSGIWRRNVPLRSRTLDCFCVITSLHQPSDCSLCIHACVCTERMQSLRVRTSRYAPQALPKQRSCRVARRNGAGRVANVISFSGNALAPLARPVGTQESNAHAGTLMALDATFECPAIVKHVLAEESAITAAFLIASDADADRVYESTPVRILYAPQRAHRKTVSRCRPPWLPLCERSS